MYSTTQIVMETVSDSTGELYTLVYLYDEAGAPIGMKYRTPTYSPGVFDCFFFEKNLQGDIVAVYDSNGTEIATYVYTAWGECTMSYTSSTANSPGLKNPFKYRGYYHDSETGWYYLNSRYYNPSWGRFVNADAMIAGVGTSVHGYNLFVYCFNDPIDFIDLIGYWPTSEDLKNFSDVMIQGLFFVLDPIGTTATVVLHYNRNALNETYTEQELLANQYEAEPDDKAKFHQTYQIDDTPNRKYVIGEWFSSENVFYSDGTLNDTPEDGGTFNIYSGDSAFLNTVVHGYFDVIPYMIWGNNKDDSTTIIDRVIMIFK